MKAAIISKHDFLAQYPEQKPVCLNYATVREDMLALIEENEALRVLLDYHIRENEAA